MIVNLEVRAVGSLLVQHGITCRARKCRSTDNIDNVCSSVRSLLIQLGVTSGAGKSRSTEIIMRVEPSYGAIWSVCAQPQSRSGRRKNVSKEKEKQ
jgi:hypothetical protein